MTRILLVAVLCAQVCVSAQQPARIDVNPFANDAFWRLHTGSEQYVANLEKAKSGNPVEAIEANFAIGTKQAALRAARGLLTATPAEFARGARVLVEHDLDDDGTALRSEFLAFVADARTRVASFSGEDGADAASVMLTLEYIADRNDEDAHRQRVRAFRAKFAGTRAAELMRVSQVDASRRSSDIPEWLRRYRELAREYDGTEIGAMAWYYLGSRQANCCNSGSDEIERLNEVFDIVKQLESGRFPRSEWVEKAPALVSGFFFGSTAPIPEASMPQLYARYLEFVLAHPVIKAPPLNGGVEWIVRDAVSRLAPTPVQRVSIVEEFVEDLVKRGFGVNDARMLLAQFYFSLTTPGWIADHMKGGLDLKEAEARAIRNLRAIIESAQPDAVIRAHHMLGGYYFGSGQYASARSQVMAVQSLSPDAEWNWVAALRLAQIQELLGQKTAVGDYEAIAFRKNLPAAAVLLSRVSAAELREQAGELPAAAAHYRAALVAWQSVADPIDIFWHVAEKDGALPVFRRFAHLKKSDVQTRLDRLSKAVTTEEALLYEGRRALELDKPREAVAPLKKLVEAYPKSTAADEGRRLLRRAQLADILTTPQQDVTTTDRSLAALGNGAYDSVTSLSKLARAALKVRTNAAADAESLVKQALEEWHTRQATTLDTSTALARDVAAIRAELFRPQGGGIYGTGGGNGFRWPAALPSFQLVSRDIQIKTADGKEQKHSAPFAVPAGTRAVFVTVEDQKALHLILDRIGGTDTNEWTNALDLPNQPIGGSVQVAQLWSKFFPLRPGHWGGWELTVYPDITRITFDREGHALAEVTIGYGGGTYELEKENGRWVAKRMVSMWIT